MLHTFNFTLRFRWELIVALCPTLLLIDVNCTHIYNEIGMSHCRKRLYVVFQIGILRIEFEMPISTHCVSFLLLKCQSVDKLPYSTHVS